MPTRSDRTGTRSDGAPQIGTPAYRSHRDATETNFLGLTSLLDAHRICWFAVPDPSPTRLQVGILAADRARVVDACVASAPPGAVLCARPGGRDRLVCGDGRRHAAGERDRLLASPTWRYFVPGPLGGTGIRLGLDYGSTISSWEQSPGGGLRTSTPNPVSRALGPGDAATARVRLLGADRPTLRAFCGPPRADEIAFPVDAVYLWVDGADPEWQARRDARWRSLDDPRASRGGLAPHLYRSRDELRYSLRSLEMFAPFIRRVHLVTDDQVPPWLDPADDRIRVVGHRDLFEPEFLPSFNSNAINARIHRIPDLAEQFLVLNDDILFAGPVVAADFFLPNGSPKIFLSRVHIPTGDPSPDDNPADAATKNLRRHIEARLQRRVTQKFKHIPSAQRRSLRFEVEREFPDLLRATASHPFRHADDVVSGHLASYYGYLTGRTVPATLPYRYVNLAHPELERLLAEVRDDRGDIKVVCLNDEDAYSVRDESGSVVDSIPVVDRDARDRTVARFLEARYPLPASFERGS